MLILQHDITENNILALQEVAELEFKQAKAGTWKRIKFHVSCYNSWCNTQERIGILCRSTLNIPDPFQSLSKPIRLYGLCFNVGQGLKFLVYLKIHISEHVLYNLKWWSWSSLFFALRRWSCFIACVRQSRHSEDLLGLSVITEMAYFAVFFFCETEGASLIHTIYYRKHAQGHCFSTDV